MGNHTGALINMAAVTDKAKQTSNEKPVKLKSPRVNHMRKAANAETAKNGTRSGMNPMDTAILVEVTTPKMAPRLPSRRYIQDANITQGNHERVAMTPTCCMSPRALPVRNKAAAVASDKAK